MNPRKLTKEEKKELLEYLVSEGYGMGTGTEDPVLGDLTTWIDAAPLAVFDNYQTDYPGYEGKVLVILPTYDLHPEVVEIYVWDEGKITRIRNEEDINKLIVKNLDKKHGTKKQ